MTKRSMWFLLAALPAAPAAGAHQIGQTAGDRTEILHLIRRQKLDLILPGTMRDNNVVLTTRLPPDLRLSLEPSCSPKPSRGPSFPPAYGRNRTPAG